MVEIIPFTLELDTRTTKVSDLKAEPKVMLTNPIYYFESYVLTRKLSLHP